MSQTEFSKLLSPGKIGTMELKNRIVLPPMGTDAERRGLLPNRLSIAMLPMRKAAPACLSQK